MKNVINVHDLKTNYSKYLDEVIEGKEILLGKHGKPVAKLVPLADMSKPRQPGRLKNKAWVSDDFDEPLLELWADLSNK